MFGEGTEGSTEGSEGRVGLLVGVVFCVGAVTSAKGTGNVEVALVVFVLSEPVFDETIVILSRGMSQ